MKKSIKSAAIAVILLSATMLSGCSTYSYVPARTQTVYENPQWAPPYYEGARYYYLPDLECYYDLSTREFIYLNRGQWFYSTSIPSMYADFDLDNCFTVVLNVNVYRPWMHHQYYVSHYPRYYYRDYYDHSNIPYVRGFNENSRSAVYWRENERNRARKWDNENQERNRKFKYSKDDRDQKRDMDNRNVNTRTQIESENRAKANRDADKKAENVRTQNNDRRDQTNRDNATRTETTTRQPQNEKDNATRTNTRSDNANRQQPARTTETEKPKDTNYYGRTIGNPVKVDKQMKEKTETRGRSETKSTGGRR